MESKCRVLTEEKSYALGARVEHSLLKSIRPLAKGNWSLKIVITNCHKILKLKSFKTTLLHELKLRDPDNRENFVTGYFCVFKMVKSIVS